MDTKSARVFIVRPDFAASAIQLLKEKCSVDMYEGTESAISRSDLLKRVAGVHAIYCTSLQKIDAEVLHAAGSQLKVVATMSVGYDHVDLEECKKRNIQVGFTPEVLTDAVADLTVLLVLAATRNLLPAHKHLIQGTCPASWNPTWMCGYGLAGSTVGIVGLGRIGEATLKRLKAFNVKRFLYCGRSQKPNAPALGAEFVPLKELLSQSDFVIALCATNESTTRMFNKEAFTAMKPTACFVNAGRGALVDQDALYEALTTGQIRSAGLDVTTPEPLPTDHPLLHLDNCIILPHIGSADFQTRTAMAELTVQNILAALEGRPLPAPLV